MKRTEELLEAALTYQKRGWSLFPINAWTKKPLIKWKSYQDEPADENQIKKWWKQYPFAAIGLITGKISNLIVLDIDGEEGKKYLREKGIPPTPCVKTKRGEHYYFRHPGFVIQNFAKKEGLDLRGDGGFVILPPSKHPSGITYEWIISPEEESPADPPVWLLDLITRKEKRKPLAETELSKLLDGVKIGKRHFTATRIAGHYIGKGLPGNEVTKLLRLWNGKNNPPLPESELTRIVEDFSSARGAKEKTKGKGKKKEEETKTLIPGLIHLVKDGEKVKYLVKTKDRLEIKETYIDENIIYRPKQNLPIKMLGVDILNEPTDIKWNELLDEVVSFIETYLEMPDDKDYFLLALWVFHTYLIEKFNVTPYLYFYGVKETGKTRAGEILGELAFKCERLTSPTEATLFRSADYFKTTLVVDEIKLWGKDGNPEVARLIKSRYKRGLSVSRCILEGKKGEDQLEYFDVFSPLVICTTEGIPDSIENRSLVFTMQKNSRIGVEKAIDEKWSGELRKKLTIFRAAFFGKKLPQAEQIARRRLNEIMIPLYQSLLLIEPIRKEEFLGITKEMEKDREEEEGETLESRIVEKISAYELETQRDAFLTTEIRERLNEGVRDDRDKVSNMLVSIRIKRLGFKKTRLETGKKGFSINRSLLTRLKERYLK